jgi:alpha-L-rhamnosidase
MNQLDFPFNRANWITTPWDQNNLSIPSPIFRKHFVLPSEIQSAILHICGLGHYEIYLNGERIGDRVLDPAFTDYNKTVLYSSYVIPGDQFSNNNCIGLFLGRGRYNMYTVSEWNFHLSPWRDACCFILSLVLTMKDGTSQTITSNNSWKCHTGPIFRDSMYEGEGYDARQNQDGWLLPDYKEQSWEQGIPCSGPAGIMSTTSMEPVRIIRKEPPVSIYKSERGTWIADFGTILAGTVRLSVEGSRGTQVTLQYAETLHADGRLNAEQDLIKGDYFQQDDYILCGKGKEVWNARFSYKGFRFVEVSGWPGKLEETNLCALVMHNDVALRGTYICSEPLINKIHQASRHTLLINTIHVITDTPTYEKNGWTGDAQLTCQMGLYNFEMEQVYRKFLADMRDSQLQTGELGPIVPTSGWGLTGNPNVQWPYVVGAVPAWDVALFEISHELFRFTGNREIIDENYQAMKSYLGFLQRIAKNFIIDCGLGDWAPASENPEKRDSAVPPEGPALSSTAYFYYMVQRMEQNANLLGFQHDELFYKNLKEDIYQNFNKLFFDVDKGYYETPVYDGYRQTSNILPLAFGLVPEKFIKSVRDHLVHNISIVRDNHLNTGILGVRYLFSVLCEAGAVETAFRVATQTSHPSWGFWFEMGHTTLGEFWAKDSRTWSHHMFGSIDSWFYQYLAGISPPDWQSGRFQIAPYIPSQLDSVEASLRLPSGVISSCWQYFDSSWNIEIELPKGSSGKLCFPSGIPGVVLEETIVKNGIMLEPGKQSFTFDVIRDRTVKKN